MTRQWNANDYVVQLTHKAQHPDLKPAVAVMVHALHSYAMRRQWLDEQSMVMLDKAESLDLIGYAQPSEAEAKAMRIIRGRMLLRRTWGRVCEACRPLAQSLVILAGFIVLYEVLS